MRAQSAAEPVSAMFVTSTISRRPSSSASIATTSPKASALASEKRNCVVPGGASSRMVFGGIALSTGRSSNSTALPLGKSAYAGGHTAPIGGSHGGGGNTPGVGGSGCTVEPAGGTSIHSFERRTDALASVVILAPERFSTQPSIITGTG